MICLPPYAHRRSHVAVLKMPTDDGGEREGSLLGRINQNNGYQSSDISLRRYAGHWQHRDPNAARGDIPDRRAAETDNPITGIRKREGAKRTLTHSRELASTHEFLLYITGAPGSASYDCRCVDRAVADGHHMCYCKLTFVLPRTRVTRLLSHVCQHVEA